jgi:NADH-quinone oxidoreductase subunit A
MGVINSKQNNQASLVECGANVASRQLPFSVRFFLLIVVFLIFDVELILLLPYGVNFFFRELVALLNSLVMIGYFILSLYYE